MCVRERDTVEVITPAKPCSLFDQGSMFFTIEATGKTSFKVNRMFFKVWSVRRCDQGVLFFGGGVYHQLAFQEREKEQQSRLTSNCFWISPSSYFQQAPCQILTQSCKRCHSQVLLFQLSLMSGMPMPLYNLKGG